MRRLRKNNPQVESGTRSLHSAMMPDQINTVLQDIDSMLAEANKTIDQSLHHSAQLVEQAQQQLLARHQHLMAPSQSVQENSVVDGDAAGTTAASADNSQQPSQNALSVQAKNQSQHDTNSDTKESALVSAEASTLATEVKADTEALQSATSELEKVLESSAKTEKALQQEQQHIVEKQKKMQQTAAAAQKSIESALTNINQGFMHQQQAYEQAIVARAKTMEEKNQAAASALSQSLKTQQPDKK